MTRRLTFIVVFLSCACLTDSFGQTSLNDSFEKARDSLLVPLAKYKQIIDINSRRSAYTFDRTDSSLSFVTDSVYDIKASYAGTVFSIIHGRGNEYCLTTKYGDYFISYCRLTKPVITVGDKVQAGQILARLIKDHDEFEYRLDFSIFKFDKSVDIYPWLKL